MHIAPQYEFTPLFKATVPSGKYNGIVLCWSEPSRFDIASKRLGTGPGAHWLSDELGRNGVNFRDCELRLASDATQARPGTKAWLDFNTRSAGAPFLIPSTCFRTTTYNPDDVVGHLYEAVQRLKENEDYEDEETVEENKDKTPTRLSNRRHWASWAVRKIAHPEDFIVDGIAKFEWTADRNICIQQLRRSGRLYLDIETDYEQNLLCIGFARDDGPVCVLVVRDHNGLVPAPFPYIDLARALTNAEEIVVHNGAFDLMVLAFWYRLPFTKRIWDTMVVQHRYFPEAEKSLHHTLGTWTWLPDHKGEFIIPRNHQQLYQLLNYNAKDVHCMRHIRHQQERWADCMGVRESISIANRMVRPYIIASCTGIKINQTELEKQRTILTRKLEQMLRLMRILVGQELTSTQKCVAYYHDTLGYPPVAKSKTTGKPKLGAKELYKLAVRTQNPSIIVVLAYRKYAKAIANLDPVDAHRLRLRAPQMPTPVCTTAEVQRDSGTVVTGQTVVQGP